MYQIPIVSIEQIFLSAKNPIKVVDGLMIEVEEIPQHYQKTYFRIERLYEERVCFVDNDLNLYEPVPVVIPIGLEFIRFNKKGDPIFTYNNEEVIGYRNLSYILYGKYDPLTKYKVSPHLEDDFESGKLKFRGWVKVYGNLVPEYSYGTERFKGIQQIKKRFPLHDPKYFDTLERGKPQKVLLRHEELIKTYDIRFDEGVFKIKVRGVEYELRNPNQLSKKLEEVGEKFSSHTKKKVLDQLKYKP